MEEVPDNWDDEPEIEPKTVPKAPISRAAAREQEKNRKKIEAETVYDRKHAMEMEKEGDMVAAASLFDLPIREIKLEKLSNEKEDLENYAKYMYENIKDKKYLGLLKTFFRLSSSKLKASEIEELIKLMTGIHKEKQLNEKKPVKMNKKLFEDFSEDKYSGYVEYERDLDRD